MIIVGHVGGCGVRVAYFSNINNSEIIKTPNTRFSGINLCEIFNGIDPQKAKQSILRVLSE